MNQPRDPDSGQFRRKGASFWAVFFILFLLVASLAAWKL